MNKAEAALRQKLAKMRQASKGTPVQKGNKPAWEQLLDKALEKEAGGRRRETEGETRHEEVARTEPSQEALEPAREGTEIGAWSSGPGVGPASSVESTAGKPKSGYTQSAAQKQTTNPPATIPKPEPQSPRPVSGSSRIATTQTGPENLVIIRPDSLGDLILFEPVLRVLRDTWRTTRIHILATPVAQAVASMMPENIGWHFVADASPFAQPDATALRSLREAVTRIEGRCWLLSACARKTWWDVAIPALGSFDRRISLGQVPLAEAWKKDLEKAGLDGVLQGYLEAIPTSSGMHEAERSLECASYLLGCAVPEIRPSLSLSQSHMEKAAELLSDLGLAPGRFIACCPAGTANVSIKCWPTARFAETLSVLASKHGLGLLLLGGAGEAGLLLDVSRLVESSGFRAPVWTGAIPDDFGLLCALLSKSILYLGNDTGPMHAAAALGKPVVGLFGGGTWPRFLPRAARGAAVVRPMSCFGCDWQCHFGDAPCIRLIETGTVVGAADELLSGRASTLKIVEEQHGRSTEFDELSRSAAVHARTLRGRLEHLSLVSEEQTTYIEAIRAQLEEARSLLELRTAEAEQRLATLREQDGLLSQFEARVQGMERDKGEVSLMIENLKAENVRLASLVEEMRTLISTLEAGGKTLEGLLAEREASIEEHVRTILEQTRYIDILKEQAREASKELDGCKAEMQQAKSDAADREGQLALLRAQIRETETKMVEMDGDLKQREKDLRAQLSTLLEQTNFIELLKKQAIDATAKLTEKENLLQEARAIISERDSGLAHVEATLEQVRQEAALVNAQMSSDLARARSVLAERTQQLAQAEATIQRERTNLSEENAQLIKDVAELRTALAETQAFARHLENLYAAAAKKS